MGVLGRAGGFETIADGSIWIGYMLKGKAS